MAHPFAHRLDAAAQLAARLLPMAKDWQQPIVLALVRGGVPVGACIARDLDCPWEPLLVRKLGAWGQPEVAWGAVALGMNAHGNWSVVRALNETLQPAAGFPSDWMEIREQERHEELLALRHRYALPDRPCGLEGRTAIVVDDGVATGCSLRAAMAAARSRHCHQVVLAIPVAPSDVWLRLRAQADEGVCLVIAQPFVSVSAFYGQFPDVQDHEIQQWIHP